MGDPAGAWDSTYHAPVLIEEVVAALAGAHRVLDGTLGGGGHAAALLAAGARVDAVDRDPEAVLAARARLEGETRAGTFRAFLGNFAQLDTVAELRGQRYDGILLDLGVSSHQLDDPARGFSFRRGAPLDMRMSVDTEGSDDAASFLNGASEADLAAAFRTHGDEPRAKRLTREIVRRRASRPFATSDDFVGAIRGALGARTGPSDFARLFQAVRIAVNDEHEALVSALPSLRERLTIGAQFAIIAYHSGEDRVVKRAFQEWSRSCRCPPRQPHCTCGGRPLGELMTRKAIVSPSEERARNPRARSARLRVWRRSA